MVVRINTKPGRPDCSEDTLFAWFEEAGYKTAFLQRVWWEKGTNFGYNQSRTEQIELLTKLMNKALPFHAVVDFVY